ncbi:MAG: regulatory protein RecX [Sedimenticola sp.]
MRLLVLREHSRAELRRKLQSKVEDITRLDPVLDSLESRNHLSDERFTEQYIAFRKRKGFGPSRIRLELRERGIDSTLAEEWLDERDEEWLQLLEEANCRKFGSDRPVDFKEWARRARFLEYRGFPPEMIRQALWRE